MQLLYLTQFEGASRLASLQIFAYIQRRLALLLCSDALLPMLPLALASLCFTLLATPGTCGAIRRVC